MSRPGPVLRDPQSLLAVSAPPPPVLTLSEIVQVAVEWQPEAEAVIESCVAPGGKTQALARRGAQVITVFRVLRDSIATLPASPAAAEVDGLLNYHLHLIEQVLLLGFRPDSPERERVAAHCRGGLGEPGFRLRLLSVRLGYT